MSTKKFSELNNLDVLAVEDIFAVTDIGSGASKKVTSGTVFNFMLSDTNLASKSLNIRNTLNSYNTGAGNGLNSQYLFDSQAGVYRDSSYYLDYTNLSNRPVEITSLSQLSNEADYVKFNSSTSKMVVSGAGSSATTMSSDYVNEGAENLFYSDVKVDGRIELNFGSLFNVYSSTFDGGEARDSLEGVQGTFQFSEDSAIQSDTIRISTSADVNLTSEFSVGQVLRLYGASSNLESTISDTATVTVTASTGWTGSSGTVANLKYKLAKFNLKTGDIGPSTTTTATTQATIYAADGNDPLPQFNTNNFISLSIGSVNADEGVLVYRDINDTGTFKLLAVLGPKDLVTSTWKDYHLFDYTSWSGKNSADNTFSNVIHFPLTAPAGSRTGWTDVAITQVVSRPSAFDLVLQNFVYTDVGGAVEVCHNDTNKINEAIATKSAQGKKSIDLNAKTYNVSHIRMPNNFGLRGTANITKIKKLPWSSYRVSVADNSVIKTMTSPADSISLVGIDVDGNNKNQVLLNDAGDASLNYIVNFGINPRSILIDRCRVRDVAAGGIYTASPIEFKMNTSEVINSGVTDRHIFSPLLADAGLNTFLTGNRFENYSGSIDLSVTREGVVSNNLVKACGEGLFVYGATFFLSSPNVLIGAANEYLPSPDILNSEYDSININRSQLGNAGNYTADEMVYQENGEPFDLTYRSISTIPAVVEYRTNLVRTLSNGVSEVWGNEVGPSAKDMQGNAWTFASGYGFVEGKRYVIQALDATGATGTMNWMAIGAANTNPGTEFVKNSTAAANGSTGYAVSAECSGTPAIAPLSISNASVTDATKGQFTFSITSVERIRVQSGDFSAGSLQTDYNGQIKANDADGTKIHPVGSKSSGLAWSANLRRYVKLGQAVAAGTWVEADLGQNPVYQVQASVDITSALVARSGNTPGTTVRLSGGNFATFTGTQSTGISSSNYGEVISYSGPTDLGGTVTYILNIKFWNGGNDAATGIVPSSYGLVAGDSSTTINIIDDFVMAQGLFK